MTSDAAAVSPRSRTESRARVVVRAINRALETIRVTAAAVLGLGWRFVRPYVAVVSPLGWLVVVIAGVSLLLSAIFGWQEFFFLGATMAAAILVATAFVFGRSTYDVSVELTPRRVVAGERALGRMLVTNAGPKRLLPTRMELPVGESTAEFSVPQLPAGGQHEELFAVPTERRAVIDAGPAISVRGDQLGLLRRTVKWTEALELFVHPVTVRLAPSVAGLVRDLEGQVSKKITDHDISFHALRAYVPGDDRRYVHWRTSARTGQLMVRQFEETRRSQLTIIHSVLNTYYADEEEFELAVSVTASIAAQVIRDGTQMNIVTEQSMLRTHSAMAMLDDSCRLQAAKRKYASAREFAREATKRLPAPSVAIIVAGSHAETSDFRSIQSLFPADTTLLAVRVDHGASPRLAAVARMSVLTVGQLADLPALIQRAGS